MGDKVKTGQVVTSVAREGSRWLVSTPDARWIADAVIFAAPSFLAARVLENGPATPDFQYSPWLTANLTLDRWPSERGAPMAWDNVIVDSPSLGYVVATHQSLRMHIPRTVWTYYWALADGPPRVNREWLLAQDWRSLATRILDDLSRAHPDIRECVSHIDICRMGHAMIRPTPGFLSSPARRTLRAHGERLYFAHSDLSGLSLFEEAQSPGRRRRRPRPVCTRGQAPLRLLTGPGPRVCEPWSSLVEDVAQAFTTVRAGLAGLTPCATCEVMRSLGHRAAKRSGRLRASGRPDASCVCHVSCARCCLPARCAIGADDLANPHRVIAPATPGPGRHQHGRARRQHHNCRDPRRRLLKSAGFPAEDVQVIGSDPRRGNLVARLRGRGNGKPVLFLAHLDVVPAMREDWTTDPYTLVEKDGYFYGRGTIDDKQFCATLAAAFGQLKREGFVPERDLVLALTTGEESGSDGIKQFDEAARFSYELAKIVGR